MSMIGKTLGHYAVSTLIGSGGMGEVYQAKDQKLGRDVAIKVLPEELAQDAGRVARFQREAKLLASLNHANIAAIHGLEESDGTHFLVLELVKGDTLADQIKKGPLPVEEALKLQGRYKHITPQVLKKIQQKVDKEWEMISAGKFWEADEY